MRAELKSLSEKLVSQEGVSLLIERIDTLTKCADMLAKEAPVDLARGVFPKKKKTVTIVLRNCGIERLKHGEIWFKLSASTKMSRVMDEFCLLYVFSRGDLRFLTDGEPLRDEDTAESLDFEDDDQIDVSLPKVGDIGEFTGQFTGQSSLGREFLLAGASWPSVPCVRDLVQRLGGSAGTALRVMSDKELLGARARSSLVARVEQARGCEPAAGADFKLRLELRALVCDDSAVNVLVELLGAPISKVRLRRTEAAPGQVIAFHRDVSRRTLQVPLNEPGEYEGGRLVFATAAGELLVPTRVGGSCTVHDSAVVHGVTELTRGVRYALFLLHDDAAGQPAP